MRRSGRATKGQHTKNLEETGTITAKRNTKGKRGKAVKEAEATPPPEEEAIIRCICGYVEEDENDDRVMVICDQCEAWQHNECMEISENSEELPDQYYCEQCRPEHHKELLAKVNRGEKPWEERARQREREEEERKQRRRKGGKKGKKARPSNIQPEKIEESNGKVTPPIEPPKEPPETVSQELPKQLPKELAKEIPKELPEELPEELPKEPLKELPVKLPPEVSKEASVEAPKDISQVLPKDLPNDSIIETREEHLPKQVPITLPQRKVNHGLPRDKVDQDKETINDHPPTSGQKRKLPSEEILDVKPSHEQVSHSLSFTVIHFSITKCPAGKF